MAQKIINGNGIVSLGTVECEEDLKPQPGITINGPPRDGRCDCCGRHISELKPFGGPGDPLVGDFSGALLIKNFRPDGPYDEEAEKAYKESETCYKQAGFDDIEEYLSSKNGQERGEEIFFLVDCHHSYGKSWECRDCAVLSTDEYFKKLKQSWT